MEIERETSTGSERGRSWRANLAQEDAKKLEDSDQLIKVNSLQSYLFIAPLSSGMDVRFEVNRGLICIVLLWTWLSQL